MGVPELQKNHACLILGPTKRNQEDKGMLCCLGASSHGVPSPTHVNKFQHGGKVPTFESQEPMKDMVFVRPRLLYAKIFLLDPTFNTCPESQLQKVMPRRHLCHIWGLKSWDHVWSGKSQLPCSQQMRLHGFTSSEPRLGTWDPMWTDM